MRGPTTNLGRTVSVVMTCFGYKQTNKQTSKVYNNVYIHRFLGWFKFWINFSDKSWVDEEANLTVVRLVLAHLRFRSVGLPHVYKQRTSLRKLFPAFLTASPVICFNSLVHCAQVFFKRAFQHFFPAFGACNLALYTQIHVHNFNMSFQLCSIVKSSFTEFTVKPDYFLMYHLQVFVQITFSFKLPFAYITLYWGFRQFSKVESFDVPVQVFYLFPAVWTHCAP